MVFLTLSVCISITDTLRLHLASYVNNCFTDLPCIRAVCKRRKGRKHKKIRKITKNVE